MRSQTPQSPLFYAYFSHARHPVDTQRYLQHIGFTGAARPDLPTLQQLHHRHMLSVPFENLSIIYHQGIRLAPEALFSRWSSATAAVSVMS